MSSEYRWIQDLCANALQIIGCYQLMDLYGHGLGGIWAL